MYNVFILAVKSTFEIKAVLQRVFIQKAESYNTVAYDEIFTKTKSAKQLSTLKNLHKIFGSDKKI